MGYFYLCQRIDAFGLWCWRRFLRVPCTARRSNQSILKEINPEYSLEGLMLKLKLQYFGHLMWRADSVEKTLMLGKIEGRGIRGRQRMRWLDGITDSWTWVWVNSGSWWWMGRPGVLQSMGLQRVGHGWVTELKPFYIRNFSVLGFWYPCKCPKHNSLWILRDSCITISVLFCFFIVTSFLKCFFCFFFPPLLVCEYFKG